MPGSLEKTTRLLQDHVEHVAKRTRPPSDTAPAATVLAVASALTERARRAKQRRLFARTVAALVAAAALVLVFVRPWTRPPGESHEVASWKASPSDTTHTEVERLLTEGTRIQTEGSKTHLSFQSVTSVDVHEHSSLALVSGGRVNILRLDRGSLSAQVKKLTPDERFIVRTLDAEVEVRGTRFHVQTVKSAANCEVSSTTQVRVDEGVVVVRFNGHEHAVSAGQVWPTCAAPVAVPEVSSAPASVVTARASVARTPSITASTNERDEPLSLSAQNDLFARAMHLKNEHQSLTALSVLDDLLRRAPAGPLAESAYVERMQIYRTMDREHARREAEAYLKAYPQGFGRAAARAILEGGP